MMRAQRVGMLYGWMWLKQGLWLFKRNPFLWMFLTSMLVVGMFASVLFPIVGPILPSVLFPAFFAGLMLGAHALAEEKALEPQHLLEGFKQQGARLLSLGVLNMALNMLVGSVLLGAIGGEKFEEDLKNVLQQTSPESTVDAINQTGIMLPMEILALVSLALQFIVQIAAMLIVFRHLAPFPALVAAFRAVLRNALPLLVYAVMLIPFALLATLPYMLGWVVLLPIILATQYAIYRDFFPMPRDMQTPSDAAPPAP